ncbi:hypothetical protein I2492_09940 [Budviciaceae bacterium CWB-B4]|uniref:Uncharacterized protein n=1 Tax=Limnobaculum xujianqingii TaxID=2738837 RepID=A0A9D7FTJ5_9GAMM|nr:hypothetical protein [Limnobaculum xujianqingii]MBK5073626.1 hypothetical protein [Limnobaculum xujianqingii]MBK5176643.1 hypothetical protein [Limnobaculum xujianqingii]
MTSITPKKPKAIKGPSPEFIEFLTCIILHMLVPLLPLILELWKTHGTATDATLAITASMYSISIGLSSRNKAIFSFCIFISILFSMAFGFILSNAADSLPLVKYGSFATILLVFGIHACERYNKHVVECVPFWNFSNGSAN